MTHHFPIQTIQRHHHPAYHVSGTRSTFTNLEAAETFRGKVIRRRVDKAGKAHKTYADKLNADAELDGKFLSLLSYGCQMITKNRIVKVLTNRLSI